MNEESKSYPPIQTYEEWGLDQRAANMERKAALFTSKTDEWPTPDGFHAKVVEEFGVFHLDPAADATNAKAPLYFTKEDNGLAKGWVATVLAAFPGETPRIWVNPPYGRGMGDWVAKAYEESQAGALVVMLLPARTDTAWFHNYAIKGEIRFVRGRLKFGDATNAAPFPSLLVVFRPPVVACPVFVSMER